MRTAAIFAAAIAFVAPVLAQSDAASIVSSLPSCGQTCILEGIAATGCSPSDSACLCSNAAYQSGVTSCVTKTCSSKDALKVAAAAPSLCPNGTGAQAVSGSSAAASSAPASSAPASSAASVASSAVVASSSSVMIMSSSSAAMATKSSTMMGSATGASASATTSKPAVFTGAASNIGAGLGFLAMLGIAAAV